MKDIYSNKPSIDYKPAIKVLGMCQASQARLQLADPILDCQWLPLVAASCCTWANIQQAPEVNKLQELTPQANS